MKELFVYDEEKNVYLKATLEDICDWWLETYPNDYSFFYHPEKIIIREAMKELKKQLRGGLK